jgi:hypothetical protein
MFEDIYKQLGKYGTLGELGSYGSWTGEDGKFYSSRSCESVIYNGLMTVIIFFKNYKFTVCNKNCYFAYISLLICPDPKKSSTLATNLPGLFNQKYHLVDINYYKN